MLTDRPDAPGPLRRRGPRPLLLHLTLATLKSSGWNGALPTSSEDWRNFRPLAADPDSIPAPDPELLAGIAAYRRHPWKRELPEPLTVWGEGGTRLYDYAPTSRATPVLFVPSLVNRAYILDLAPGNSLLRHLAGSGLRPMLLDWGWPAEIEKRFTLTDYVAGRLERAMAAIGRPVILAGYCMGGLLAVAAATRRPELVTGLALLATPWDFHADAPLQARGLAASLPFFEPALQATDALSVDTLQTLFALLQAEGIGEKYRGFGRLDPMSERARRFVALEDWLNDGVPLAAPVARECLRGWYGENAPARGEWRITGAAVEPRMLRLPCFVAIPDRDRIVPPESARPLADAIEGARVHEPASGHVSMVAGAGAKAALWDVLAGWLREIDP